MLLSKRQINKTGQSKAHRKLFQSIQSGLGGSLFGLVGGDTDEHGKVLLLQFDVLVAASKQDAVLDGGVVVRALLQDLVIHLEGGLAVMLIDKIIQPMLVI